MNLYEQAKQATEQAKNEKRQKELREAVFVAQHDIFPALVRKGKSEDTSRLTVFYDFEGLLRKDMERLGLIYGSLSSKIFSPDYDQKMLEVRHSWFDNFKPEHEEYITEKYKLLGIISHTTTEYNDNLTAEERLYYMLRNYCYYPASGSEEQFLQAITELSVLQDHRPYHMTYTVSVSNPYFFIIKEYVGNYNDNSVLEFKPWRLVYDFEGDPNPEPKLWELVIYNKGEE